MQFEWEHVLSGEARRVAWLFEHQCSAAPLRSFFATLARACVPWRFWRSMRLTDRVFSGRLRLYALLWSGCFIVVTSMMLLLQLLAYHVVALRQGWAGPLSYMRATDAVVKLALPAVETLAVIWAWLLVTFWSLLIFRKTLARFRIRTAQVRRVAAYAPTVVVFAPVLPFSSQPS